MWELPIKLKESEKNMIKNFVNNTVKNCNNCKFSKYGKNKQLSEITPIKCVYCQSAYIDTGIYPEWREKDRLTIRSKKDKSILIQVSQKDLLETENNYVIVIDEVEYKTDGFIATIVYRYSKDYFYLDEA